MYGRTGTNGAMRPGVVGKVTAINGTTLTISGFGGFGGPRMASTTPGTTPPAKPAAVTYTVDASNATVMKANATSTLSSVARRV